MGTFVRWSGSLLTVLLFPQIQNNFKEYTFVPSIVMLSLLLLTLLICFPETKNKDQSEIAQDFQQCFSSCRSCCQRNIANSDNSSTTSDVSLLRVTVKV